MHIYNIDNTKIIRENAQYTQKANKKGDRFSQLLIGIKRQWFAINKTAVQSYHDTRARESKCSKQMIRNVYLWTKMLVEYQPRFTPTVYMRKEYGLSVSFCYIFYPTDQKWGWCFLLNSGLIVWLVMGIGSYLTLGALNFECQNKGDSDC